ncbi:hypothetical protein D910_10152, partial [Dendroctonus ponderosae]
GSCVWNSLSGRQVILQDTDLLHLSEVERKVLQKVAIAKLQALNLGVCVKVPTENIGAIPTKKRRPYLLKRKALTTGIFDSGRKDVEKVETQINEADVSDGNSSANLVFGIPLTQCVENDRLRGSGRSDLVSSMEERSNMARHGSRASFSSLIDSPRGDETGSCESLMGRERIVGSVPGLLDALSCSSAADIPGAINDDESVLVPNILSECIRHLEQHGLHTFGIFRVSASKKRLRQLREDFDSGKETTIDDSQCPHDVANLLKEYLRELPDPLLCRDLYHAFIQTQRIRNRRLQLEALQHLVQLLPAANRDTLYALLSFLARVAENANDRKNALGEELVGNKMDSNNLATVFAPNILHCIKPGSKDVPDRSEDRIDVINVVRTLIDHCKNIFALPADLVDEIYLHMTDSYPEALEQILTKKDAVAAADESVDELDSEPNSAPWTPTHPTSEVSTEYAFDIKSEPKKTYSREEFLHETAATGGPNVGMRVRHKDKIRERSLRRKREKYEDGLLSRIRSSPRDEDAYKGRSSSLESTSSAHTEDVNRVLRMSDADLHQRRKSSPYVLDNTGVLTASLTIPVQAGISYNVGKHPHNALKMDASIKNAPEIADDDIPYIEEVENGRHHMTIGVIKGSVLPQRRRNTSVGSDSSITSNIQPVTGSLSLGQGYDSAVGSSAPTTYSSPLQNTPTSVSSSIADHGHFSSPPSWTSSPPTSPDSVHTSVNYIPDDVNVLKPAPKDRSMMKEAPIIQKVSFAQGPSPQTIQKVRDLKAMYGTGSEILKSSSASSFPEREPRFTPSITSIGNAVLKSKTADFERIIHDEAKPKMGQASAAAAPSSPSSTANSERDKKKYTKRRYTDSRHPTRHIPDSETLEAAPSKIEQNLAQSGTAPGPVYKRRELISSVHSK